MKLLQKYLLLIILFVLLSFSMSTAVVPTASAGTCPENRWVRVPNWSYVVPAYPEKNATYWVFEFRTFRNMKLEIKGAFPYARYMSLILYDYNTGEVAAYNNQNQILIDRDINTDSDTPNPYLPGVDRYTEDRSYTVYVVRADNQPPNQETRDRILADGTPMPNTLVIPSEINVATIFLRVYLPDDPNYPQGEVPLPQISVIDLNTGLASPCPPQQLLPPTTLMEVKEPALPDDAALTEDDMPKEDIYSFGPGDGWGLFGNGNNPYLIAPLWPWPEKVAIMKFKAPIFTKTRLARSNMDAGALDAGISMFGESDEVRYFSVCMSGIALSNTSACLSDEDLKMDANGIVHIAVVPNGTKRYFEDDPLWNIFEWGIHANPVLLFRQIGIDPAFEKSFKEVESAFSGDREKNKDLTVDDVVDKAASEKIGEYGPKGVYCELNEFENNRCGW